MKQPMLLTDLPNGVGRVLLGCAGVIALMQPPLNASAQNVNLGTANNFAVMAGSTVTSTGPTVIIGGNVGASPGTAVTGFPPGTISAPYTTIAGGPVAAQAQADLNTAFNYAAGLAPNQVLSGQDLGGLTLTPGVYFFASTAQLTGTLTLNDQGNPNAEFVFQIGSSLTTAANSSVLTINGGTVPGADVFWQVGSSATLETGTAFEGNLLAYAAITAAAGATDLDGRLLAETGAVTLAGNTITVPASEVIGGGGGGNVPDTGSTLLLLGSGFVSLLACGRRVSSVRW